MFLFFFEKSFFFIPQLTRSRFSLSLPPRFSLVHKHSAFSTMNHSALLNVFSPRRP